MNSKKIMGLIISAMLLSNTATVFAAAENTLSEKRIYGRDRYETSIKISNIGWKNSSYAVICRGDNFADALCSVPLAKKYNAPILLTQKDRISKELKDELKRLNVSKVYITGGEAAVNKTVEQDIKSIPSIKEVNRLGGKDRYSTSISIAKNVGCSAGIVLTTGTCPADALSMSSIAASKNMPILLTSKDKKPIQEYLKTNKVDKSFIIGGEIIVSKEIEDILPSPERIYGKDRFITNQKIIERFSDSLNFKTIYMALGKSERGDEFADALSSAALAAKDGNPIVLVYKDIYKETENIIRSKLLKDSTIVVIGGERLIPENIVYKLTKVEEVKTDNTGNSKPSDTVKADETVKPSEQKAKYTISKQLSFPGSFTYDLKVNGIENLTGYQLVYDGQVIAEDKDGDGIVTTLSIFFGQDVDKSKFKVVKDGKEIIFNLIK